MRKNRLVIVLIIASVVLISVYVSGATQTSEQAEYKTGSDYQYLCFQSETNISTQLSWNTPIITSEVAKFYEVSKKDVSKERLSEGRYDTSIVRINESHNTSISAGNCAVYVEESPISFLGRLNADLISESPVVEDTETDTETNNHDNKQEQKIVNFESSGSYSVGDDSMEKLEQEVVVEKKTESELVISGSLVSDTNGGQIGYKPITVKNGIIVIRVDVVENGFINSTSEYRYTMEFSEVNVYKGVVIYHKDDKISEISV